MSAILTRSDVPPTPANQVTVKCPRCDRTYRLNYTDDEWRRVKDWIAVAERVLREAHKRRHDAPSLALRWDR